MIDIDIEKFLEDYSDILLEDHKETILHHHLFLNEYSGTEKVVSKFGLHFVNCLWAQDTTTSGPDTCACCYLEMYRDELKKLMNWYIKYVNK